MITLRTTTEIDASPGNIWAVMVDWEHWPDWTPTVAAAERLDSGPPGIGSRVRVLQPKLPPTVWTVTVWEPEKVFVWESRRPGTVTRAGHAITPGQAGSRVDLSIDFGGLFGGVVGRLAKRLTTEYLTLEAAGLKRRCEQP